jgi:hypothetical protein
MRSFLLSVVLLIISLVGPAFGWPVDTHLQMTRDAIALMPEEFQKTFKEHQAFVESGIRDPDELLKDWQNHYFIPAIPEGGALDRIEKIATTIQTKLKSPNAPDVSKQLCYLAHYIADLWTPEDSVRQASRTSQDFLRNNDIVVFYEGYPGPIENFHDYFLKRSIWRWRLENSKEIEPLLYSEAVNDITNAWLTLWEQSGQTVVPQKARVIDHKRGVLTANFDRMLLEEKYDGTQWDIEGSPLDKYRAHMEEMKRLSEGASPSEEALAANAQMRNQELMMSKLGAGSPFAMIETSLRRVGDKSYLVARIRNKSDKNIVALSLMYPGIRGAVVQVKDLKAGQIAKLEGVLPADARKDQIQLIFATAD